MSFRMGVSREVELEETNEYSRQLLSVAVKRYFFTDLYCGNKNAGLYDVLIRPSLSALYLKILKSQYF